MNFVNLYSKQQPTRYFMLFKFHSKFFINFNMKKIQSAKTDLNVQNPAHIKLSA